MRDQMDAILFLTLIAINAYHHCWLGLAFVAAPLAMYLFKRRYSRAATVLLLILVFTAIAFTALVAIWWPTPTS